MDSQPGGPSTTLAVLPQVEHPVVSQKVPNGQFPEPVVIPPQLDHRQTFIILHGRGSTAEKFCHPLLATPSSSGENLQTAFPHARLVFLTASRTRATIYKKAYTHQWFDSWHENQFHTRQDLMRDGLRRSCAYVHGVLRRESEAVGEENVVLWGLSQGCATSLISLLAWDGKPVAAVVGMCGYLPFANHVIDIMAGGGPDDLVFARDSDDDDALHRSDHEQGSSHIFDIDGPVVLDDLPTQAVTFLRDEIDMEHRQGMIFQKVPVFLGHGVEDQKVSIGFGREAKTCLDLVGVAVQMVEYEGLGHWYSPEMLGDIFDFLREKLR